MVSGRVVVDSTKATSHSPHRDLNDAPVRTHSSRFPSGVMLPAQGAVSVKFAVAEYEPVA